MNVLIQILTHTCAAQGKFQNDLTNSINLDQFLIDQSTSLLKFHITVKQRIFCDLSEWTHRAPINLVKTLYLPAPSYNRH